ncbi:helix-turn-helix domain-containing protein [Marinomonas sp. 5E14-1]|uniref:helix-turn-helix domain-containing protein n=1 Tax=Marinomonas sp. 5E14-1 TaxID=3153922 RepID=UPI0032674EE4
MQAYLSQHLSYREIGKRLNVSHSSISRELKRHTINGTYEPSVAQRHAQHQRHYAAKSHLIGLPVSHEWIYGYVQRDKRQGGKLYKHLRHNSRRYRKKTIEVSRKLIVPECINFTVYSLHKLSHVDG